MELNQTWYKYHNDAIMWVEAYLVTSRCRRLLFWLPPPPKVKEVMFSPLCLFVCLCAGYLKKLQTDPDEILWRGSVCDKGKLIRFWWRSESGSGYSNFLSDSSSLRDSAKNDIQHDISKSCWTALNETWWACWVCDKEELIQFWWRSESESRCENYLIFKVNLHHRLA